MVMHRQKLPAKIINNDLKFKPKQKLIGYFCRPAI